MTDWNGIKLDLNDGSDTLFVSCSGIVPPNTLIYAMEASSGTLASKRMFLCDTTSRWFYGGMPGITTNMDETVAFVGEMIDAIRPSRVVSIGTSAGGYLAIMLAYRLGFDAALAFSPQTNVHPDWRREFGDDRWSSNMAEIADLMPNDPLDLLVETVSGPQINIVYPSHDRLDAIHATRLPANTFEIDTDNHNVSSVLHAQGRFAPLLDAATRSDEELSTVLQDTADLSTSSGPVPQS